MVLTDFLKNLNSGNLQTLVDQAKQNPQTITGQDVDEQTLQSDSFQQAASIFDNILGGRGLPESEFESVTSTNLINLGKASIDISEALKQTTDQQNQINNTISEKLGEVNNRLSEQVVALGDSLKEASAAIGAKNTEDAFAGIGEFFTGNILGIPNVALLAGGIIVLAVVLK